MRVRRGVPIFEEPVRIHVGFINYKSHSPCETRGVAPKEVLWR